jgi:aquaporin Z
MKTHDRWREYLAEAAALALFMISASIFGTLLEHYRSPVQELVPSPAARRVLMGIAMGLSAIAIIYSPLGARSGAHMNPSVTLAFARLGRVQPVDAGIYILSQFVGGLAGMSVAYGALGHLLSEPAVEFVQTRPGPAGLVVASIGELAISFVMMSVVLRVAANPKTMRFTGAAAGLLVMLYIIFESPLSGMSMNPARTLAPAVLAGHFEGIWIYFVAPPLGMFLAAEWFRRQSVDVPCAKLNHPANVRCIFCEDLCITTSSSSAAAPAAERSLTTWRRRVRRS